ncbi:MAG: signal peptidase I [Spirochaetaceae bacterium]|jgi:signal peptidase I|nr:signal peptidase I [Spirochaetaceae bacterium]
MEKKENAAIIFAIISALGVALVLKLFFFDFMIAEGESMSPAIRNGRVLLVNRLAYGFRPPLRKTYLYRWALPDVGNIVVFYTPPGVLAVKRCAGVLSDGRFLALGDNSLESYDSRAYGSIPLDNIVGRVVGIK